MNKKSIVYILIGVFALLLMWVIDASLPSAKSWEKNFDPWGTAPYDTKIFREELTQSSSFDSIVVIDSTFYEWYKRQGENKDTIQGSFYVFLGRECFRDESSIKVFLDYIKRGNDAFLISDRFSYRLEDALKDSFNIEISIDPKITEDTAQLELIGSKDSFTIALQEYGYIEDKFSKDTVQSIALLHNESNMGTPVFVRIPYGKGFIYLNTLPVVFTNYYLLNKDAASLVNMFLSYTDKKTLIYQDFSNTMRKQMGLPSRDKHYNSPLQLIFHYKELKYAWYLLWVAVIVFVIFTAKRKQRMIPVIQPLANMSVLFVKSIAQLFFESQNHKLIAEKRIVHFLENLRSRYFVNTLNMDNVFVQNLAAKSGVDVGRCQELLQHIQYIQSHISIGAEDLVKLDRLLYQFNQAQLLQFSKNNKI